MCYVLIMESITIVYMERPQAHDSVYQLYVVLASVMCVNIFTSSFYD